MFSRDLSLTVALSISLLTHALLLAWGAEVYSRTMAARSHLQGYPILPTLQIEPPDESRDPRDRLGDPDGRGSAVLSSAGDLPMHAPKGIQDQPLFTRDAIGAGSVGQELPESALQVARAGAGATSPQLQPVAIPNSQDATQQFGLPAEQELSEPAVRKPKAERLVEAPPPGETEQPASAEQSEPPPEHQLPAQLPEPPPQKAAEVAVAVVTPSAPTPVLPQAATPPHMPSRAGGGPAAPQGESDSDPITTEGSADFRMGGMDVRLGRKFKLTRPRFELAGETDLFMMRGAVVKLKLVIDPTGKVTAATVFRSSGRTTIDQPCVVAAYGWWFEPLKDTSGNPIKDVLLFTLHFQ